MLLVGLDASIQFAWALLISVLLCALTITLGFAVFGPYMRYVGQGCSWLFHALLAAWAITAVQMIMVAQLVSTAATGTSEGVFVVLPCRWVYTSCPWLLWWPMAGRSCMWQAVPSHLINRNLSPTEHVL